MAVSRTAVVGGSVEDSNGGWQCRRQQWWVAVSKTAMVAVVVAWNATAAVVGVMMPCVYDIRDHQVAEAL